MLRYTGKYQSDLTLGVDAAFSVGCVVESAILLAPTSRPINQCVGIAFARVWCTHSTARRSLVVPLHEIGRSADEQSNHQEQG